jgi:hypothetical protein
MSRKPGLYANILAKQERQARQRREGRTVERTRRPGEEGAPTAEAFRESAKTAKPERLA